jgi:RND family efflux transporter MFP subunit
MKKITKKIVIVLVVAFVAFFLWQRFFGTGADDAIESYTVSRGNVMEMVSDSGEVHPERYANLSFEVPTVIEWVGVHVGDEVEEGQELVRIDRNQLASQIHAARIDVDKAVAEEQLARRKWEDLKPEERQRYRKNVEQARTLLLATQSQWSKTVLESPISGIVTQQEARVGEVATGTVIRVIDPHDLHIEALMSESDVVRMFVGQEAQIVFDAFDDEIFTAKITQIEPEAVVLQDVTYYRIHLDLDHIDERVRSGMSVDVDIVVEEKEHVLNIPLRFVRSDDIGMYVYIASADAHEKKYVTLGLEGDEGNVEIIEGLDEGQEIYAIYEEDDE